MCDSTFPALGPDAPQSCSDVSTPNNNGKLDCRTSESYGGYDNIGASWGKYKIRGGSTRYNGTKTRVERFFNKLSQENNTNTILTGRFRIYDLSDGNTCIIQSHAGGQIMKGVEAGKTNRSAQFLLYARKSGSQIVLETHVTTNPYTTDSGGSRTALQLKTINYGQEYTFRYETGYNSSNTAFSFIKVGGTERSITHNHTTQRVYTRYGAYGTSDTGDVTAHIQFKDINLCRN
ncbi:hypothetical protein [Polaribacter glomeratus]|uniref:Alginate lyase 2 domain-containing protein n=1 Tax=Polaribacter glomeratus TaxID=102 RepID=A0A2S7WGZ3_9FLAO|nr:hypothetical protein [Polaribacter glomeratus]PQJ76561.1 hypothetical protein BTO16_11720 [Polaribacter glomeratus]TXD67605.1 hypothetical protein ESX12_03195 [Polaribacter glomeratus]